jgi:hypothetical protein
MNITMHIERVVLEGLAVAPAGEPALRAAIETELARLLAAGERGAGWAPLATPRLAAPPLRLPEAGAPGPLGVAIARAVHGVVRP